MRLRDRARFWNATDEERTEAYACNRYLDIPYEGWVRAVDVEAPADVVFRWLCQLKIAPYSYDWLDNAGRRSPSQLAPGTERLARGQRFLVFEIVDFEPGRHISGVILGPLERIFGPLAITYRVRPKSEGACRLVVRLDAGATGWMQRMRRWLLGWGDLLMMRKQLLTLKELAECQAAKGTNAGSERLQI